MGRQTLETFYFERRLLFLEPSTYRSSFDLLALI